MRELPLRCVVFTVECCHYSKTGKQHSSNVSFLNNYFAHDRVNMWNKLLNYASWVHRLLDNNVTGRLVARNMFKHNTQFDKCESEPLHIVAFAWRHLSAKYMQNYTHVIHSAIIHKAAVKSHDNIPFVFVPRYCPATATVHSGSKVFTLQACKATLQKHIMFYIT